MNMDCKNFKVRSKKYKKYFFCIKKKKEITYQDCSKCIYKEYKKVNTIKNKSNNLKNLERKRYSILTNNYDKCYKCDKTKKHTHEIYKGRNRKTSILNGFCIPLCEEHHRKTEEDMDFDLELKIECENEYRKNHTKEDFISLIGESYIAKGEIRWKTKK